ncbi:MAG: hypothetical protein JNM28_09160 [Armatimonadetes bacterium]|nr:hypothetical protein [Armatimonadota bacterium]
MKSRGNSLVGLLAAVAIVILAILFFTTGGKFLGGKAEERADGKGETLIGKSIYAGKDDVCISNLKQLRMGIEIATDQVEGTHPQSIEETKLGAQFYSCPVGGEPYRYDPATGQVRCPHKGHEKY